MARKRGHPAARPTAVVVVALLAQALLLVRASAASPFLELGVVGYVLVAAIVLAWSVLGIVATATLFRRWRFARGVAYVFLPGALLLFAGSSFLTFNLPADEPAWAAPAQVALLIAGVFPAAIAFRRLQRR